MTTAKELRTALEPFARAAKIIDALPRKVSDDTPAREVLPGIWPTVGDLRVALKAHGKLK